MRERLEKARITIIVAAVSLSGPDRVSAHIFDERPGLGKGMTIILTIFWVSVVIGIIFLVRRLMRPRRGVTDKRSEKANHREK